jgi:hypothetical protein
MAFRGRKAYGGKSGVCPLEGVEFRSLWRLGPPGPLPLRWSSPNGHQLGIRAARRRVGRPRGRTPACRVGPWHRALALHQPVPQDRPGRRMGEAKGKREAKADLEAVMAARGGLTSSVPCPDKRSRSSGGEAGAGDPGTARQRFLNLVPLYNCREPRKRPIGTPSPGAFQSLKTTSSSDVSSVRLSVSLPAVVKPAFSRTRIDAALCLAT